MVNYGNVGENKLIFNTGGLNLSPGGSYVMFLSVSQYYNQSTGLAQVDAGDRRFPAATLFTTTTKATLPNCSPTPGMRPA